MSVHWFICLLTQGNDKKFNESIISQLDTLSQQSKSVRDISIGKFLGCKLYTSSIILYKLQKLDCTSSQLCVSISQWALWYPLNEKNGGHLWYSSSALDCWSTDQAIDPAPGAWFMTKFLISPGCSPPSIVLQVHNLGLKYHSFSFQQETGVFCHKVAAVRLGTTWVNWKNLVWTIPQMQDQSFYLFTCSPAC